MVVFLADIFFCGANNVLLPLALQPKSTTGMTQVIRFCGCCLSKLVMTDNSTLSSAGPGKPHIPERRITEWFHK